MITDEKIDKMLIELKNLYLQYGMYINSNDCGDQFLLEMTGDDLSERLQEIEKNTKIIREHGSMYWRHGV